MKHRSSSRRSRYAVPMLLILISMFTVTSLYYNQTPYNPADLLPQVHAAPSVSVLPASGSIGATISFSGSGFGTIAGFCTLSSPAVVAAPPPTCTQLSDGTISGSFVVANVAAGTYFITFVDQSGSPSTSAQFTVNGPLVAMSSSSGPVGTTITFSGSGFSTGLVTTCTLSSPVVAALPVYTCNQLSDGTISGSFHVANVAAGTYTITFIDHTLTPSVSAPFTVTTLTPTITLTPNIGPAGTGVSITGSNFLPADTCFSVASTPTNIIAVAPAPVCTFTNGVITSGSFTVASTAAPGVYTVTVTGSTPSDFAQATFTVTGPTIALNPISGPVGAGVTITGSGFFTTDTCTSIASTPSNIIAVVPAPTCSMVNGVITSASFGVASGAAPGPYTIRVLGSGGDFAQATFTVTTTAPTITLTPSVGPVLTGVTISGSGFSTIDTCTGASISSSPSNILAVAPAPACTMSGGAITIATFTVLGTATPGTYTVKVVGSTGDFAQATFILTGPTITLTPSSSATGATVTITGSGFVTTDASPPACTITPVSVATTVGCTISATGSLTATRFTVTPTALPGTYTITVQGATGDSASASFTVVGPAITLNPNSGPVSTPVTVTGNGFDTADTCFSLASTPTNILAVAPAPTCTMLNGAITSATFTVATGVTPGTYTVKIAGSTGDFAQATFTVTTPAPVIGLNPNSGPAGTAVTVTGAGFNTAESACAATPITSSPSNIILAAPPPTCSMSNGVITSASFSVISNAAPGTYTITVTGILGDFAKLTFVVTGPKITLTPISGPVGTPVTFSGSGFFTTDTCTAASITSSPSNIIAAAPVATCPISLGVITSGTFTVATGVAVGTYTITVRGGGGLDFAQATFTVTATTPTIILTPSSGSIGTVVTITGSGFNTADTCTGASITSSPSNIIAAAPPPTCAMSSGKITAASFTVNTGVALGTYTVTVTGTGAGDFAQATFTVTATTPTIILSPSSGPIGTVVTITGSGFFTSDTCTGASITSSPTNLIAPAPPPTCAMSSGKITAASFTVIASALPGTYTVKVTGTGAGDFAQAIFTVISPTPAIFLNPSSGPVGTVVTVLGNGFNPTDGPPCTITPAGLFAPGYTCTTVTSGGQLSGVDFTVNSAATPGTYTVRVTGSTGDFATAVFTVTALTPKITISPGAGPPLTAVTLTATGFAAGDTVTFSPSGLFTSTPTCGPVVNGACTATNTIKTGTLSGSYTVIGTGTAADSATTIFIVGTNVLSLNPSSGPSGTLVSFSGVIPSGPDTQCSVGGGSGNSISISTSSCVIVSTAAATTSVAGSFVVGNLSPGAYSVRVSGSADTGNTGTPNYVDATFIVTGAQITLTPNSGRTGIAVTISGSGFSFTDNTCTMSVSSGNGVILNGACSITGGTGTASGSFTVANVPPGTSIIRVTGSQGDYAEAVFTLTGGASITLNPSSGGVGITVSVSGSGFRSDDSSCSISGTGVLNPACSITVGTGTPTGSFVVYNVAPGAYVIQLSGSGGDYAQATFTVTSGASITLNPASGRVGVTVTVTGAGFRTDDSSCSISGSPVQNPSCSINLGTGIPSGSFVVYNIAPGAYLITLSGSGGDFAQATFTVTAGASITLNPSSGGVGVTVTVTGSGFRTDDSSCSISGTGVQNPACTISLGSGTPLGSFVVASVAPGAYVITLSGSGGDSAQAFFTVQSGASIVLHPISGGVGITVTVTGTGFRTDDSSCSISGSGSIVTGTGCSITLGTGTASGSFIVASVSPGAYIITLSANQGDSAQTTFTVTTGPTIVLTPSTGAVGVSVTVTGAGFLPADSSCSLSGSVVTGSSCIISTGSGAPTGTFTVGGVGAGSYVVTLSGSGGDSAQAAFQVIVTTPILTLYPGGSVAPGTTVTFTATGLLAPDSACTLQALPSTIIITSATCTVSAAHVATGSFVVSTSATANQNPWTIQVVGSPGSDIVSASLTVIPGITVTPASGTIGTQFSFTGTGFSSAAVSCSVTISPGTWTSQSCGVSSNGQVSGSFISNTNTPGTYAVTVADNAGFSAGSFATIGAPSAQLTISPNVVSPGQVVLMSGSGFNAGDTSCTITPASIISAATCSIGGGIVSATFTTSTTIPGLYLMTVTGNSGDFASNYLEVAIVTGLLTTSTSVSTSVTLTTFTNVTTSIPVSLTTTTYSWTGPYTWTINTLTTTSLTGESTVGLLTTTTTTSLITSTTTTLTSQTVTGIYTIGGVIGKSLSSPSGISGDMVGLISVLTLLGLLLIRRWAF